MTVSSKVEIPQAEDRVRASTKWAIALFFVVIVIPGSFYMGVRMTPYRLYLIVMAIPAVLRFRSDPTIRINAMDVLMTLAILWCLVALLVVHKGSQVVFAAATFVELFCGYMLGRAFIRNAADFRFMVGVFIATVAVLLPFAALEAVTHQRVLGQLAGKLLIQPEESTAAVVRFGLMRARVSFAHPTIFGAFCSLVFALVIYVYGFPRNVIFAAVAAAAAALAISSSSLITIALQSALIVYERIVRHLRSKWILLAALTAVAWFGFQWIFSQTIIDYVLSEVMFSADSGRARVLHYEYGMREILANPLFGVGLNTWGSPYWLSQALDSFWLSTALRYGIPAFLLQVAAFAVHFVRVMAARPQGDVAARMQAGYLIAFFSAIVMLFSVSFYQASLIFFMMFCGAGVWLYDPQRPAPEAAPRHPRGAAAEEAVRARRAAAAASRPRPAGRPATAGLRPGMRAPTRGNSPSR